MTQQKFRVVLADDESPARERLRRLLQSEHDVQLVGEAADGPEAVRLAAECKPDVIILDVALPELDGFQVLAKLGGQAPPSVIFVTELAEHAVRAFEARAADYLLKPYSPERFRQALNQARQRCALGRENSALPRGAAGEGMVARIAIRSRRRSLILAVSSIRYVLADDANCKLFVNGEAIPVTESLRAIEKRLPGERFLRISRFALVNLDQIAAVEPKSHGDQIVVLSDNSRLAVARTRRRELLRRLAVSSGVPALTAPAA